MSYDIIIQSGNSKLLPTAGKYCKEDIVITAVGNAENLENVLDEQEELIATLSSTLGRDDNDGAVYNQRLEYIESTGTQYIDTGIIITTLTDLECVAAITENTKTSWIAGTPVWIGIHKKAGTVAITQNSTGMKYNSVDINTEFSVGLFGDKVYFNNVQTNTIQRKDSTKTLFLFAYHHENDTGSIHSSVRIYSFKIWDNGKLVRNFIPVLDQNNVPCMYDEVNRDFFYNQGTGEFLYEAKSNDKTNTERIQENNEDLRECIELAENFSNMSCDVSIKDVNFYDYDGTLLRSYSVEETQELTELPELPSHDGLVCQGWNVTLDEVKTKGSMSNVFAMYITDDGKTRLYISVDNDIRMTMPLCFSQTVSNGVMVDWGDGTIETFDGTDILNPSHEYSAMGDYIISLDPQSDCTLTLGGKTDQTSLVGSQNGKLIQVYASMLKKVEIGNNIKIVAYSFHKCNCLDSITIPYGITEFGNYTFQRCSKLRSIAIPNSVTTIGGYVFAYCFGLTSITIPNSVTSISNNAFYYCYNLESAFVYGSVTEIGSNAFDYCYLLKHVLLLNQGIRKIGRYAFSRCYSLSSFYSDSVYYLDRYAFSDCVNLQLVTLDYASTITLEQYAFQNCAISAPPVTKTNTFNMYSYCFSRCANLLSFSFQNGKNFGADYFTGCSSMAYLDFTNHTSVPTLGGVQYVTNINNDCKILVPATLYDEWIAATNWSDVADRIVAV